MISASGPNFIFGSSFYNGEWWERILHQSFRDSSNKTLVDPRQHTETAVLLSSLHRSDDIDQVWRICSTILRLKVIYFKRQYQIIMAGIKLWLSEYFYLLDYLKAVRIQVCESGEWSPKYTCSPLVFSSKCVQLTVAVECTYNTFSINAKHCPHCFLKYIVKS